MQIKLVEKKKSKKKQLKVLPGQETKAAPIILSLNPHLFFIIIFLLSTQVPNYYHEKGHKETAGKSLYIAKEGTTGMVWMNGCRLLRR